MSQSDRPKPFSPHGAIDGAVVDSNLAKQMKICMRFGNSCGIPFIAKEYFKKHIQWKVFEPYVFDRLTQPWTMFASGMKDSNQDVVKDVVKEESAGKKKKYVVKTKKNGGKRKGTIRKVKH
jgi:hypothetical protein